MKTRRRLTTILAALLFSMLVVGSIFAQDDPGGPPAPDTVQAEPSAPPPGTAPPEGRPGQANADPPGRVARIQYMSGEVSMQPGGVNDWVAASQNRPLTTADRVWTDKNSKTELSVGNGFLRMNSETSVTLSNVSDNTVQVELDQGTLELTVRQMEPGEIFEVDTPNAAFTVMKNGVYRFDVFPNEDQTSITVRKGSGQATGQGNAVKINSGQQVRFSNGTSLVHTAEAAPSNDGFDDWARVRDDRLEHSESARYVSPGVIGAQDLDQYGTWQTTPQYGAIWVPTSVTPGWAPYRNGHWAWIDPWGWTWVDDAPWGFAPFHYGRWVSYGGYWGWAPGPIGYGRPYYAPALVGWIGGPGFGIGFGGGGWGVGVNFGWFALGFGEPFYPWYGGWGWGRGGWYRGGYGYGGYCSRGYFNRVNISNTHITNITNVTNNYYSNTIRNTTYVNRNVPGAVTAAPKSAFTSGAAINRAGMAVPSSALRNAQVVRTAAVSPTKQSVLGGHAPATHVPPAAAFNRPVVTQAKPPARPAGFGTTQPAAASRGNATQNGNVISRGPNGQAAGSPQSTAHNVPRPPSAGGSQTATNAQSNAATQGHNNIAYPHNGTAETRIAGGQSSATHTVPRPPSANDSFARGNTATNTTTRAAVTPGTSAPTANHAGQEAATTHNVPRPPSSYTYPQQNHGANSAPSQGSHPSTYQQAPAQHQAAPVTHEPPAQHSSAPPVHESAPAQRQAPSQSKSDHSGPAAMSVPKPPASYTYRGSPTYTASSAYGSNRVAGSPNSRGGSPYANGSTYGRPSGYSGGTPGYPAAGNYRGNSSAPAYNTGRSYGAAPSYNVRSAAPSGYSAPRASSGYSGGGGGHASGGGGYSGGGGGHPSGGGGGYSSGGGGHASSGGGGGGHHGR